MLKITSSLCKIISKVTNRVKNTAHYTYLLYILLMVIEIFNTILCFISDDNNQNTNFVYKIQTILVDYLKENLPIVDKIFYFSDSCGEQYKNCKTLLICLIISNISIWMLHRHSLKLVMASHHAMVLGDLLNIMLQNVVYKDLYKTKF